VLRVLLAFIAVEPVVAGTIMFNGNFFFSISDFVCLKLSHAITNVYSCHQDVCALLGNIVLLNYVSVVAKERTPQFMDQLPLGIAKHVPQELTSPCLAQAQNNYVFHASKENTRLEPAQHRKAIVDIVPLANISP
jgi:hypothetical protein